MHYKGEVKYISMTKEFAFVEEIPYSKIAKTNEHIIKFVKADFTNIVEGDIIYYSYAFDFIDCKEEITFRKG